MARYRITREEYYDEYTNAGAAGFYILEEKTYLFLFKRWTYITHRVCNISTCYRERTKFKSLGHAESFVRRVLCTTAKKTNPHVSIMKEIEF